MYAIRAQQSYLCGVTKENVKKSGGRKIKSGKQLNPIASNITMEVLQGCKQVLAYTGLGTKQYVKFGGIWVPRTLIRAILSFMLLLACTSQLIISINNYDVGLQAMLFPLHCVLLTAIKCAVYLALVFKSDRIARLLSYFEMVVKATYVVSPLLTHRKTGENHLNNFFPFPFPNRVQSIECILHHLYHMEFESKPHCNSYRHDIHRFDCIFLCTISIMLDIDIDFWCSIDEILGCSSRL